MNNKNKSLFVGVETVRADLGVSRSKAYEVIRELNASMKEAYPKQLWCPERLTGSGMRKPVWERGHIDGVQGMKTE